MSSLSFRAIVCLLIVVVAAACTPARRKVQGDIVRSIHIDGNGAFFSGHNDYQLQGAMEQGNSGFGIATFPLNYLTRPVTLNRGALSRDSYRLETWYAQNGWFDAQFLGWEVHQIRRRSFNRAGMVRILGQVQPGTPSLVRSFSVTGRGGPVQRVFTSTVKRTGSLQPDSQFSLFNVEATKSTLLELYRNNAYPYATVDVSILAYPDDHVVDIIFDVDIGPSSTLGEITVTGAADIEPFIVRQTIGIEEGEPYNAEELRRAQRRLFALGTYSIVNITPDLSDRSQSAVPIRIELTETRFQTLRLGGGVDYDSSNITPRLSMRYKHVNLLHRLIQAKVGGSIGYRIISTQQAPDDSNWNYRVDLSLSTPRLAGPNWSMSANIQIVQETLPAQYTYFNPATSLRFTHRFTDRVSLNFGPSYELYRVLGKDNGGLLARSLFGADFDGDYRLAIIDASMTFDWRDDPLDTTRGTFYQLGLRQALPVLSEASSDRPYSFTDVRAEARTYRRMRVGGPRPFTLAARLRGQAIISQTSSDADGRVSIPYPERLFLGGSADLRGFRVNHVGPYETVCTYTQDVGRVPNPFRDSPNADGTLNRRYLPRGGEASVLGSLEGRFSLPYGLSIVPFVDAGLLSPSVSQINPKQIRFAGGIGARYASVVGPIRIDLAFRPLFPEDLAAAQIIGCEPGDAEPRGVDLLSSFAGDSGPDRTVPFAVNLIITIGQAF